MEHFLIVFTVLVLCCLAMAVGLIIRNKGFTTCGRAAFESQEGNGGTCSVCGSGSSECRREKKTNDAS